MKRFDNMDRVYDKLWRNVECKYGDLCEYCELVDVVREWVSKLVNNALRNKYSEKALTEEIDLKSLSLTK